MTLAQSVANLEKKVERWAARIIIADNKTELLETRLRLSSET